VNPLDFLNRRLGLEFRLGSNTAASSVLTLPLSATCLFTLCQQHISAKQEPAFLRQVREFLSFPMLPRETSKRVPIFDRRNGCKPTRLGQARLRVGFLQTKLSDSYFSIPVNRSSSNLITQPSRSFRAGVLPVQFL
jgi:hypothetical protein